MVDVINTLYHLKKISCCVASGYFVYKILDHTFNQQSYSLIVNKVYKNILKIIHPSSVQQLECNNNVEAEFFWFENAKCRKHLVSRMPCDSNFCSYYKLQYIINFILSATETIDLCMFLLTSTDIAGALIQVFKKGVKVRVIVEEEMSSSSESKIQLLINEGIVAKSKVLPTLMHHKFCLVDANNSAKHKLLTGSLNWTLQGLAGNWENIVVLHHSQVIKAFSEEFNNIWEYFNEIPKKQIPLKRRPVRN